MNKLRGLEISTHIGCRLNCRYCPQDVLLTNYFKNDIHRERNLSLESFKKALESVEEGGFVSFCGMVEPFHNNMCADMIKYAYEHGYRVYLFTTLMGMTEEDFDKIKDVKLDFFELHVADEEKYCHFVIDDNYKKMLTKMQKQFNTYTYCCHGTLHHDLEDIIDSKKIVDFQLEDRAGLIEFDAKHYNRTAPFICHKGFQESINVWIPVMLPDGTLVACCNDYGMKHEFGNLVCNSWDEISKGQAYQDFIRSWHDASCSSICNHCISAINLKDISAIKLKDYMENPSMINAENLNCEELMTIDKIARARRIIVWGTGNFFKDHYSYFRWNECLKPAAIIDNNVSNVGQKYDGIECESVADFKFIKGDIIVPFVKNASGIINELERKGLDYVLIDEIMRIAGKLKRND